MAPGKLTSGTDSTVNVSSAPGEAKPAKRHQANQSKNDTESNTVQLAGGLSRTEPGPCGKILHIVGLISSIVLLILTLPYAVFISFKVVKQYERAVIFRLGRIRSGGARGPGTFFILPCLDDYKCIDLRTKNYDVPAQVILTRDSVSVAVDAVVYYRVFDPVLAVANVVDYDNATRLLAATTLRNTLGMRSLQQVLSEREDIAQHMQVGLDEATDIWGVKVERVEVKDVRLPQELQRAMAAEAEASRQAKAKVIAAEGEMNASRSLKEASDMMAGSPGALQLRYLQTLSGIATEGNSTILFPLPVEFLRAFQR